jgi:hypothetical protein
LSSFDRVPYPSRPQVIDKFSRLLPTPHFH